MIIKVLSADLHILNTHTRMPFRYGIATMTALPHVFVRLQLDVDGETHFGISAEGLAPKWFTKNPDTSFKHDVEEMVGVIQAACGYAQICRPAETLFDLWQELYALQRDWAEDLDYPPLLWNFGVSLVERAMIDAFCQATQTSFADAVHQNTLGVRLGEVHDELADLAPADLLPAKPLQAIIARHTVGLTDPLTDDEISEEDQANDGLPQSLHASIQAYGLTHFKIKIGGNIETDFARLKQVAQVIEESIEPGTSYQFTLDGNEQYKTVESFQTFWEALTDEPVLASFLAHLIFVEQPFHRDLALSREVANALNAWEERPPIIIDESDASLNSLPIALESGYCGTSHKNCKGIFKGLANACLIRHRQAANPERRYLMSGEDLCNIGPVALLQDMTVLATLGIEHAERNGHHYFAGLKMLPSGLQEEMLMAHNDMYRRQMMNGESFVTVQIHNGKIQIGSTLQAAFGVGVTVDPSQFTPVDAWEFSSL